MFGFGVVPVSDATLGFCVVPSNDTTFGFSVVSVNNVDCLTLSFGFGAMSVSESLI